MKVLVLGATGYVGSRLVPALLAAGHEVVASSSRGPRPEDHDWGDRIEWRRCDATDLSQVEAALAGVDALVYLVHSLDSRGFADRDRLAARTVGEALAESSANRVVYLSGLVPDVPPAQLSGHISSRHEVESLLADSGRPVLALRAGVVIGAGSTSFEIIRQLATLLLVQPIPVWMNRRVQPIAVSDVVRALVEAVADDTGIGSATGSVDVGGPDVLGYPDLMAAVSRASGLVRLRLPLPAAPSIAVGLGMAALSAAPPRTALALADSLREDMVCRADHTWVPADGRPLIDVDTAITLALTDDPDVAESSRPGDAAWTRGQALVEAVPSPASWTAAGLLAVRRLRAVRRFLDRPR